MVTQITTVIITHAADITEGSVINGGNRTLWTRYDFIKDRNRIIIFHQF